MSNDITKEISVEKSLDIIYMNFDKVASLRIGKVSRKGISQWQPSCMMIYIVSIQTLEYISSGHIMIIPLVMYPQTFWRQCTTSTTCTLHPQPSKNGHIGCGRGTYQRCNPIDHIQPTQDGYVNTIVLWKLMPHNVVIHQRSVILMKSHVRTYGNKSINVIELSE